MTAKYTDKDPNTTMVLFYKPVSRELGKERDREEDLL